MALSTFTSNLVMHFEAPENFSIAPFPLQAALLPIYVGSAGDTKQELQTVLTSEGSCVSEATKVMETLAKAGVQQFNGVLRSEDVTLTKSFQKKFDWFKETKLVKFPSDDPRGGMELINEFVSTATEGKITEIVDPATATGPKKNEVYLVNAMHFDKDWWSPFNPAHTKDAQFTPMPPPAPVSKKIVTKKIKTKTGEVKLVKRETTVPTTTEAAPAAVPVTVSMMRQTGVYLPYAETDEARYLSLRYSAEAADLALVIELPKQEGVRSPCFTNLLSGGPRHVRWFFSLENMNAHRKVNFSLPKFEVAHTLELSGTLKTLGIKKAFAPATGSEASAGAELSVLSTEPVHVAKVIQKVKMSIHEAGKFVHVTKKDRGGLAQPIDFVCDRTFSYMLYHIPTQTPLVVGTYDGPGQQTVTQAATGEDSSERGKRNRDE